MTSGLVCSLSFSGFLVNVSFLLHFAKLFMSQTFLTYSAATELFSYAVLQIRTGIIEG